MTVSIDLYVRIVVSPLIVAFVCANIGLRPVFVVFFFTSAMNIMKIETKYDEKFSIHTVYTQQLYVESVFMICYSTYPLIRVF